MIGAELEERVDGLLGLAGKPSAAPLPPPRLLGSFDPLLLGWESRRDVLAANESIVTTNGLFRPFALVRGRAEAVWSLRGGSVSLEPFGRLSKTVAAQLATEADDVVRFLAEHGQESQTKRAREPY